MTETRRLPARLFALLFSLLLLPMAQAKEMAAVNRAEINMRAGPGTGHQVLWSLGRGFPVEVVGRQGQWIKVRDFERDQGWIYRSLTSKTPHHIVTVPTANIRSAPSTRSRIVGKAAYGEVLRTVERRAQWVKVRKEGGLVGWVSRKLLWGW